MSLYHGTSAANAFKILSSRSVLPSGDGFFYCFDSARPESLAGALCFATGDGPRNGSIREKDFFSTYAALNPDFPRGLKGVFFKAALKHIAVSWAKEQLKSASTPLDYQAAILVFRAHEDGVPRTRQGFVHEVKVPAASLSSLVLERVYLDDALLSLPAVEKLKNRGVSVLPISQCVDRVVQYCKDLGAKNTKRRGGPRI